MEPSESEPAEGGHMRDGLRAIWRHLQPFRGQVAALGALGLLSAVANGFVPYVTGRFFDALSGVANSRQAVFQFGSWPLWLTLLAVWAAVELVAGNVDWVSDRLRRRMETDIQFKIQGDGFLHLFRLPMGFHKNAQTNAELQKISQASWRVSSIVSTIGMVVPQFLSIVIGAVLVTSIRPVFSLVLFAGIAVYAALLAFILRPIAAIDHAAFKSWNENWDDAAASIQQIESVKQAAAEGYESDKVTDKIYGETRRLWSRLEMSWSSVSFFQRAIVFLTQLAVFVLAVRYVVDGSITIGELVALNGYALMFFTPIATLGNSWQIFQNGITTAANVEKTFREPQEDYAPAGAAAPAALSGMVEFKGVTFRYAPGQPEVLSDVSFAVKAGQSVALVGESGVGKSTTVSLVSGYYFPEKGSVEIDGIDTRRFDLGALRRRIAVVPQEVALFNDTIRANIKYGTFGASDEDVLRVAKEARIDEFVRALPAGYDTLVGERGIKLSVGQKQRVAIARAMLRDPAILVLDEPTSALDAATEKSITESLERLMRGRTTFIVAHRLSTVRKADLILVFDKGRVAESGTHDELIARPGGIYRKLYEYQIGLH